MLTTSTGCRPSCHGSHRPCRRRWPQYRPASQNSICRRTLHCPRRFPWIVCVEPRFRTRRRFLPLDLLRREQAEQLPVARGGEERIDLPRPLRLTIRIVQAIVVDHSVRRLVSPGRLVAIVPVLVLLLVACVIVVAAWTIHFVPDSGHSAFVIRLARPPTSRINHRASVRRSPHMSIWPSIVKQFCCAFVCLCVAKAWWQEGVVD